MNNTALRAGAQSANNTHMVSGKRIVFILQRWRQGMIKIRLMGTKNEIKWFEKILKRQPKVEVTEFSELYRNKGTNRYYRAYAEVYKANVKEN